MLELCTCSCHDTLFASANLCLVTRSLFSRCDYAVRRVNLVEIKQRTFRNRDNRLATRSRPICRLWVQRDAESWRDNDEFRRKDLGRALRQSA